MTSYSDPNDEAHEKEVCSIVEKKLGSYFNFKKDTGNNKGLPDIVATEKFNDYPLELAFEATNPKKLWIPRIDDKKVKQVRRYNIIRPSFLIVPRKLSDRPFYLYGKFYVIKIDWLEQFLDFIIKNLDDLREEYHNFFTPFSYVKFFSKFETRILANMNKCEFCSNNLISIELLYCHHYKNFFYPEFLDMADTGKGLTETFSECIGCFNHDSLMMNYNDCASCEEVEGFQCVECGAIFDKNFKVIKSKDFENHSSNLEMEFSFYRNNG